jgi:WD40 repeat protein
VSVITFSTLLTCAAGLKQQRLLRYSLPDMKPSQEHRLTTEVHQVEFSPTYSRLAYGCEEPHVYLSSAGEPFRPVVENGMVPSLARVTPSLLLHSAAHDKGVFGVSFDPKGEFLATAGVDSLKLWDLRFEPPTLAKSFPLHVGELSAEDRPQPLGRLSWHPQGDYVSVPTLAGVTVVSRHTMKVVHEFAMKVGGLY